MPDQGGGKKAKPSAMSSLGGSRQDQRAQKELGLTKLQTETRVVPLLNKELGMTPVSTDDRQRET